MAWQSEALTKRSKLLRSAYTVSKINLSIILFHGRSYHPLKHSGQFKANSIAGRNTASRWRKNPTKSQCRLSRFDHVANDSTGTEVPACCWLICNLFCRY